MTATTLAERKEPQGLRRRMKCLALAGFFLALAAWMPGANAADTPESIESFAREAMWCTLREDQSGLQQLRERLLSHLSGGALSAEDAVPVLAHLTLLESWRSPHPRRRALWSQLAESSHDPESATLAENALAGDPFERILHLRREDRYNRFTHLFNQPVRLAISLLTLNIPLAANTAVDIVFLREPLVEVSPREREMLALWREHSKEEEIRNRPDFAKMAEGIAARDEIFYIREQWMVAQWHLANGRWEEARESFANILEEAPDHKDARKGRLEASRMASLDYRIRQRSLEVSAEPVPSSLESEERRRLMSLLTATPTEQSELSRNMLRSDAAYSKAFRNAAQANPEAALAQARARRRADIGRFVFSGNNRDAESLPSVPRQSRTHRLLGSLHILLPVQWVLRGMVCVFTTPVPDDAWRGAAVRYLRESASDRNADSLSGKDRKLAFKLSASYERIDWFNEARDWHTFATGEEDPRYTARLDQKTAKRLVAAADAEEDPRLARALLSEAAEHFGDTKAGRRARKKIEAQDKMKDRKNARQDAEAAATEKDIPQKPPHARRMFFPPFEIEGSAGLDGFDLYPRLLPLPPDPETLPLYQPMGGGWR